jgi:excisionase family DNA binding protein
MQIEKGVPKTFSVADTAEIIGCSRSQVYVLLKTKELGSAKIRNSRRITEGQLVKYLRKLES